MEHELSLISQAISSNGSQHNYEQCLNSQLPATPNVCAKIAKFCVSQQSYDRFFVIVEVPGILWRLLCACCKYEAQKGKEKCRKPKSTAKIKAVASIIVSSTMDRIAVNRH